MTKNLIQANQTTSVYYNDVPVGTICCKMETKDAQTCLYLMTMGVLAVSMFRTVGTRFDLKSKALPRPTVRFRKLGTYNRGRGEACDQPHISSRADLQCRRQAVLRAARLQGSRVSGCLLAFFRNQGTFELNWNATNSVHENYYKKIVPRDAWILQRQMQSADIIAEHD